MSAFDADVIVVGGGLAGLAAAIAVAQAGLETLHVAPAAPPDRRTSALMMPSVDYLRSAGLIDDPAELGHPLTQIRIIDATSRLVRAPETLFDAREAGLTAFGWNFANTKLAEAFSTARTNLANLSARQASLAALDIGEGAMLTLDDGTRLHSPLLVGADGKKSLIRAAAGFRASENGFTQAALVCDLDLSRPLDGTSVEFHYPRGPFTLVPAGGSRANLVWIDDRDALKHAQTLSPEALARLFEEKSQHLFGRIGLATPTHTFALSTIAVDPAGKDGVVLVGEAAHAFPPIGAQGLNLGLRDVADLAAALRAADRSGAGWARTVSNDYARRRAADLKRTGGMVDALFRSLISELLPAQLLRAGGLWGMKALPGLRKRAFALGMGAGS
ncbi:FAD-dependent monooxygenase [Devosia nitrariae]|uniref:2-octaprenyl-6-methoxyphenyl hydroxylase n=1 Tax=Devosia nitrariae TaxID=2071872 RepID=A0ABQ5WCG6_9HYPH|nr:FAD-dependent monooxygenase [Devosia nitrariae]GLQ57642.1 2-octaprenyl-6-methoxyphenyl hydroxylase [Devosia nitrariae]